LNAGVRNDAGAGVFGFSARGERPAAGGSDGRLVPGILDLDGEQFPNVTGPPRVGGSARAGEGG
jgi:hypothetical protein